MTQPAREWGAGSDEPTGRLCFGKVGPSDGLLGRSVRTNSSNAERLRFCPPSESSRSRSSSRTISPSCSSTEIASTELVGELVGSWSESKTPSTVIGSRGGAVAVRKRRRAPTGGAIPAEAGACPRPDRRLAAAVIHRITANESAVAVAVAGAGRYRTLHLWAAMVRTPANHRLSVCTPIEGCAA